MGAIKVEEAYKLIGFAPSELWTTLGVLIGLAIIAKLGIDLVLKIRELRKPKVSEDKTMQEKLQSDHVRLQNLENTTKRQDEELKLILRGQMAMIHHMIDGNNTEALKRTQKDIEDYLITGKTNQ